MNDEHEAREQKTVQIDPDLFREHALSAYKAKSRLEAFFRSGTSIALDRVPAERREQARWLLLIAHEVWGDNNYSGGPTTTYYRLGPIEPAPVGWFELNLLYAGIGSAALFQVIRQAFEREGVNVEAIADSITEGAK